MINELYQLSAVLEQENITLYKWYGRYKQIPKKDAVRIWLSADGSVADIDTIKKEDTQSLRKLETANGMSFPAFNIIPLYRITDAEQISEIQQAIKNPQSLDIARIQSWLNEDHWDVKSTIEKSLNEIPVSLLNHLSLENQDGESVIGEIIRIVRSYPDRADKAFRKALETCLIGKLRKKEDVELCLSLLIHCGKADKSSVEDKGQDFSIFLDVYDWKQYGLPVSNEATTKWINDRLKETASAEEPDDAETTVLDAFGNSCKISDEKMPGVKVGSLAEVKLRALFREHSCQYRYGKIESSSYPISAENTEKIKAALEYLANDDNKGIFWQNIDKGEILFVYPSRSLKKTGKLASVFGNGNKPAKTEASFAESAREFSKTIWGLPTKEKPEHIRIFILKKMDKARTKVLFTHSTTPEHLIHSAEEWKRGLENTPVSLIKNESHLFPLNTADVVNRIWKQNGEEATGKHPVKWMKYYQGVELLLGSGNPDNPRYYLQTLLRNSYGLIKHVGNQIHCRQRCAKNSKEKCSDACSVIGLLLYKCGYTKEIYMNEMPYLIGQLLHVADELHTLYCNAVRGGSIPPQLIGNALFITACETPSAAVSQLSLRIVPYLAWAKQYRHKNITKDGEESWRAGWYLRLFEETANQLIPTLSEKSRFSDFEKAQLFLGYLASFPKKNTENQTLGDEENDN